MQKKQTNYSKKLLDPRWQKKRLEIFNRDHFYCQQCFDNESTLHVHHKRYFSGKEPWDIEDKYLVTLCEECHANETEQLPIVQRNLIDTLKENFFSCDIKKINDGFENMLFPYPPEVMASVLQYCLSNPVMVRALTDKYFEYLSEISAERRAAQGLPPEKDQF